MNMSSRRSFIKAAAVSTAGLSIPGVALARASDSSQTQGIHPADFRRSFAELWSNIAACTLEYANAMPEEHYDFQPVPEIRSFGDQMLHIANSDFWIEQYLAPGSGTGEDYAATGLSKDAIVGLLSDSFENMTQVISRLTDSELETEVSTFEGNRTRMEVLYMMRDHVTHHRGQTVVYLRLKGVTPPAWVGS